MPPPHSFRDRGKNAENDRQIAAECNCHPFLKERYRTRSDSDGMLSLNWMNRKRFEAHPNGVLIFSLSICANPSENDTNVGDFQGVTRRTRNQRRNATIAHIPSTAANGHE